ncbi:MAG: hypothetical protein A3H69_03400 [Candidatus Sungbacteria bacterium RIFCSPLOWO2_02_FULL_47_9]|nr:MAG: hypothetical protein A3D57_03295 [Candidatus Sungbacteria bacterium RIFCSPHIGHO2_02_FULL_46_12]OHA09222.1 MAG: hypothetical protein A3H69_03400 [Candidatus Sungbacteria bacterium RIFCSPLOWO2_02_FULL_47_9]
MDNMERGFRGRITAGPEDDKIQKLETGKGGMEKKIEMPNRERGRFIDGRVVPFETRKQELEARLKENGKLSMTEQGELNELRLKLDGTLMERSRKTFH